MGVAVNQLSTAELRGQLAQLPQFPSEAADRIVELRPFASLDDLLRKVNTAIVSMRNRVSTKAAKQLTVVPDGDYSQVETHRLRNAEFGRELCGLLIDVPWSAWDGYDDGDGFELGRVGHGVAIRAFGRRESLSNTLSEWR